MKGFKLKAYLYSVIIFILFASIIYLRNMETASKNKERKEIVKKDDFDPNRIRSEMLQECQSKEKVCKKGKKPRTTIFYIKVHKTGSTTLRSTLLTYGRTYNLTICMDATDLWGLNWPYRIDDIRLTKLDEEKCDIVAEELVFNKAKVKEIMKDDVFVMASVRHPIQHFASLYKYSHVHKLIEKMNQTKLSKFDGMRIFLKNPHLIQKAYATLGENEVRDKLQINILRPNLQLFSLGLTKYDVTSIFERAKEIDFFVVAEHYDESMVVLSNELCSDLEDVVYRKQNSRRSKGENDEIIPDDIKNLILEFNKGDMVLYLIAIKRLRCHMQNRTYMDGALVIYKQILSVYEARCGGIPVPKQYEHCPPITNGQIGIFVEHVRKEQKLKLWKKIMNIYKDR